MQDAPRLSKCASLMCFPAVPRFLTRPQLLTRDAPLPWEGHSCACLWGGSRDGARPNVDGRWPIRGGWRAACIGPAALLLRQKSKTP